MKRVSWLVVLAGFLVVSFAEAQDLSVVYAQGTVGVQSGSSWTTLSIGDSVSANATVRLSADSYLEFSGTGADITLSQGGTYSVRNLLTASQTMRSAGLGQALAATLSNLVTGPSDTRSATLGIRSENATKSDEGTWFSSEAQVYVDAGKAYIKSGGYNKAISQLTKALAAATDTELPEVHFYLGYAYSLSGHTLKALQQVADLRLDTDHTWSPDLVILKAKLLVDTFAFKQDVQLLSENEISLSADAKCAPAYYLLLAMGYRGLGEKEKEQQNLSKVVAIAGNTKVGKVASELLQKL